MGSIWGNRLKISVFGESHGRAIGVTVDGLPAGIRLDEEEIDRFMQRRRAVRSVYSTPRLEGDQPQILSGVYNGCTTGAPLCAMIENTSMRSGDYASLANIPRPGHADYTAGIKYNGFHDPRGGGHFSGRLTAAIVFAGAVCTQVLARQGVSIGAHIGSIGGVDDTAFERETMNAEAFTRLHDKQLPVLNDRAGEEMLERVNSAAKAGDSLGGTIECCVTGLKAGVGEPMFGSVESVLSSMMFSIPAVKGIEFGDGFALAAMRGSQANDAYALDGEQVVQVTNHNGGILGGISTGAPVVFRVCIKPTPSISATQQTVDLAEKKEVSLSVPGRHDSCIVPRAVPVVEAGAAIALLDLILQGK